MRFARFFETTVRTYNPLRIVCCTMSRRGNQGLFVGIVHEACWRSLSVMWVQIRSWLCATELARLWFISIVSNNFRNAREFPVNCHSSRALGKEVRCRDATVLVICLRSKATSHKWLVIVSLPSFRCSDFLNCSRSS